MEGLFGFHPALTSNVNAKSQVIAIQCMYLTADATVIRSER